MTKEAFDHILANKEVTTIIAKLALPYCQEHECKSCPLNLTDRLEVKGFKSGCASSLFHLSLMPDRDAEQAVAFAHSFIDIIF